MGNWADLDGSGTMAVARAVDLRLNSPCPRCDGTGLVNQDRATVKRLADDECAACDGFGVRRGGGGSGAAAVPGGVKGSVGENFSQRNAFSRGASASGCSENFSLTKAAKKISPKKGAPSLIGRNVWIETPSGRLIESQVHDADGDFISTGYGTFTTKRSEMMTGKKNGRWLWIVDMQTELRFWPIRRSEESRAVVTTKTKNARREATSRRKNQRKNQ